MSGAVSRHRPRATATLISPRRRSVVRLNHPFTSFAEHPSTAQGDPPMLAMRYVQPSVSLLEEISVVRNQDISLDVYCSRQVLLRNFFWLRLRLLTEIGRAHV